MSTKDKVLLRKRILAQRQELSRTQWQINSNLICDRLQGKDLFKQAKTIFAYFSFRQEVNLNSLFSLNKNWAFPRCINKSLVWHLWQPGETLVKDKYGIQTPLPIAPSIPVSAADLILVPTVACDRQGYRLGYGGGFYDRLLCSLPDATIPTVGIVFDFAYVDELPVDSWDIKLDFVCTQNVFKSNL